jgi:hypothetical protein
VLERHVRWWLLPARGALTADWANHAILGVAYVYGYMIAAEPALARLVDERWEHAALVAGLMAAALWAAAWRGLLPGGLPAPYSTGYLAIWSLYGAGAWAWMVAALGAARRWLRRETTFLAFARPRSYAWYLVHQPIVIAAAVSVIPARIPAWTKLPAVAAFTAAGTLGSAELLQRWGFVRRLLGLPAPTMAARTPEPARPREALAGAARR